MYLKESLKRLEYAKRISGDIIDIETKHFCSKEKCNPQNELALIETGYLQGPPLTMDVYFCKYKSYHVCTESTCNNYGIDGVCRISGACYGNPGGYSSYNKELPCTWRPSFSVREKTLQVNESVNPTTFDKVKIEIKQEIDPDAIEPVRKKRKRVNYRKIREGVRNIVTNLLYSNKRKAINIKAVADEKKKFEKKANSYIKSCIILNIPVNLIKILMIAETYTKKYKRLEILVYDEDVVTKYMSIIMKTFEIVSKYYKDAFKFEMIALGTLYEMRQGYNIEHMTLFKADNFLLYNLPTINDVPFFGYKRANITRGKHIIEYAYNHAIESGVGADEFIYNF